jgi:hypothetical protein
MPANLKNCQSGVGAIGVVLFVMVLAAVVGIGWRVYANTKQVPKTAYPVQSATAAPTTNAKDSASTAASVQKISFSTAAKDLQAAIVATAKTADPACVKNDVLVDADGKATDPAVSYLNSGYAETSIGCNGSAATIFAKMFGSWHVVGSSQLLFNCQDLSAYKVPLSFMQSIAPDPTQPVLCNPGDTNAGANSDPNAAGPQPYKG